MDSISCLELVAHTDLSDFITLLTGNNFHLVIAVQESSFEVAHCSALSSYLAGRSLTTW